MSKARKRKHTEFNCKEFGRRLREVRKKSKTTSDVLGYDFCEVNPSFIRQIEAGTKLPSMPIFVKLCSNLQVSPTYLLADELQDSVTDKEWCELADLLPQLSPAFRRIVDEVLSSLIENLADEKIQGDTSEEQYDVIKREEFGRRLRKVRQEMELTPQQVASSCGVSTVFINQVEMGNRLPSLTVFANICKTLQISPAYLLGNELKIEATECGWNELARIQCDMTAKSQKLAMDVMSILIRTLAKQTE